MCLVLYRNEQDVYYEESHGIITQDVVGQENKYPISKIFPTMKLHRD